MNKSFTRSILFALSLSAGFRVHSQCATFPTSGTQTISASTIVNSYFGGLGNPTASSTTLDVGTVDARGSATPLAFGDIVLIMQMQGADIDNSNTATYGALSGSPVAGTYEYNVVSAVAGSTITLGSPLQNSYFTRAYTNTDGIQAWQLVRVPAYFNLTVDAGATISAPVWNGVTGGVVAFEAKNMLTLNGAIDVSGKGFRGGGAKNFTGASPSNTAYVFQSNASDPSIASGGVKGEGIAGTPRYVYSGNGSILTETLASEGYINGSEGRGAPANAGGGATDGSTTNNQFNPGGGGGANGGTGGHGGSGWHGGAGDVNTYPTGGEGGTPGAAFSLLRLIMGGGGGAGTANNSTTAQEYQSSGAPGGGIVIVRAADFAGTTGSISAVGGNAPGVTGFVGSGNTDAAGGGGAGGTIIVLNRPGGSGNTSFYAMNAAGGNGGNMETYYDHGPGGGAGGGVVYTNANIGSQQADGGMHGWTRAVNTTNPITNPYGATDGTQGVLTATFGQVSLPGDPAIVPCAPLPLTLLSFSGRAASSSNLLAWKTASETGTSHFDVERSTDGLRYASLGRVEAGQDNYAFTDRQPLVQSTYRLKITDADGTYAYSAACRIVRGANGEAAMVSVYPNPSSAVMTVTLPDALSGKMLVRITDMQGRIVKTDSVDVQDGTTVLSLDVRSLAPGFYQLNMIGKDGRVVATRFSVQR